MLNVNIMGKKLGKISNPEQYLRVSKKVSRIDDSVKAWKYLVSYGYSEDIVIFPAKIFLNSTIYPCLIHWIAFDEKENKIVAIIPCFSIDADLIKNCSITAIELVEHDIVFVWDNLFYTLVTTSTGETVLKEVNGAWCENDMASIMRIKAPHLRDPNIYPIELFSKSLGKFICAAWAIEDGECEMIYLYLISWKDKETVEFFDNDDLEMIPLNVGDVTRAGDIILEVCYHKDLGVYVKKTKKSLEWRHFYSKEKQDDKTILRKNIFTLPKQETSGTCDNNHKPVVIPLRPKKD